MIKNEECDEKSCEKEDDADVGSMLDDTLSFAGTGKAGAYVGSGFGDCPERQSHREGSRPGNRKETIREERIVFRPVSTGELRRRLQPHR